MTEQVINLENHRVKGSRVFTGRDRGEQVRKDSKVDKLVKENDSIKIVIPRDIYSINPSFLEEFLINVVSKLGKEGFHKKVYFESKGPYNINKSLSEAIERILRKKSAIG